MEEITKVIPNWLATGAWTGRRQAFAVIANKCSALPPGANLPPRSAPGPPGTEPSSCTAVLS